MGARMYRLTLPPLPHKPGHVTSYNCKTGEVTFIDATPRYPEVQPPAGTLRPEAYIEERADSIHVGVRWHGWPLDRPDTGGWGLKRTDRALAERLVRAVNAGAIYGPAEVRLDVNNQTYVQADARLLARLMNSELRRLGF